MIWIGWNKLILWSFLRRPHSRNIWWKIRKDWSWLIAGFCTENCYNIKLVGCVLLFVGWAIEHWLCSDSSFYFIEHFVSSQSSVLTRANTAFDINVQVVVAVICIWPKKNMDREKYFGLEQQLRGWVIMHYNFLPLRVLNSLRGCIIMNFHLICRWSSRPVMHSICNWII
jgi:hypothetical protein